MSNLASAVEDERLQRERCEREGQRTERARASLESYLKTLPSGEEMAELRRRCRAKEAEASEMSVRMSALTIEAERREKVVERLKNSLVEEEEKVNTK